VAAMIRDELRVFILNWVLGRGVKKLQVAATDQLPINFVKSTLWQNFLSESTQLRLTQ